MQLTKIVTDESLMELIRHGTEDLPFQYYFEDIKKYEVGSIDWHWHNEFEFVSVEIGTAHCSIGDKKIMLQEGDGIFINSGVIHSFETPDIGIISNIVFSPEFIASEKSCIHDQFIQPFLASDISHVVLKRDALWRQDILSNLSQIYCLCRGQASTREIDIHTFLCKIWSILYQHKDDFVTMTKPGITSLSQARLRKMIRFIQQNYPNKTTLQNIAQAAGVSKSEALRCFKEGMHTSPVDYLNKYRLRQAEKLLSTTNKTITDIAGNVGFDNASYFGRMFKREYGFTPKKQRKLSGASCNKW